MDGIEVSPWCVTNLDEFIYFCCPECDIRNKSKDTFLKHAFSKHLNAQKYLQNLTVKEDVSHSEQFCQKSKFCDNDESSLKERSSNLKNYDVFKDEIDISLLDNDYIVARKETDSVEPFKIDKSCLD